jgi:hypothetical protein
MSAEDPITCWRAEREEGGGEMALRAKTLRKRRGPALDRAAAEAQTEAFTQNDCLNCGNSCATTPPIVNAPIRAAWPGTCVWVRWPSPTPTYAMMRTATR